MKIHILICFAYTLTSVLSVESPFEQITNSKYFLDKTNFIKELFSLWENSGSYIMITAPRGFAKSINLDLVKRFFEITHGSVAKEQSENYRLFTRENLNLEITKDWDFFNAHFGKYPVIYLNLFIDQDIECIDDIINQFITNVGKSFKRYGWILDKDSTRLSSQEKETFKKTLSCYVNSTQDVLNSVKILAKALNHYFNKGVILLVDNHDSFLMRTLEFGIDTQKINDRIVLPLRNTFKQITIFVSRAFFTGVVNFAELVGLLDIRTVCFEGHHDLVLAKYFGFTIEQVKELFHLENIMDEKRIENVINYFNGYYPPGRSTSVLNPWSICEYFVRRDEKPQGRWARLTGVLDRIRICSKNLFLRGMCGRLFLNKTIDLKIEHDLGITDLNEIGKYFNDDHFEDVNFMNAEVYFLFFYYMGFLTNTNTEDYYKIANVEVEEEFCKYFIENNGTVPQGYLDEGEEF